MSIQQFAWENTPLGPRAQWPLELRCHADMMLHSAAPMAVFWGEELIAICNSVFLEQMGAEPAGALGCPAAELFGKQWERLSPLFEAVWRSGQGLQKEWLFASDSAGPREERWAHLSLSPMPDKSGATRGLFLVALDVNDRVRAEAALRESRAELQRQARFLNTTLANVGDYVYVLDRSKRFVYASEKLQSLWGDKGSSYVGLDLEALGYPSDLAEQLNQQIEQVFQSGETLSGTTPYVNPEGSFGYYDYTLSPLPDERGERVFVAGVSRDITERMRADQALRRSESRYRALFNTISEGFCVLEMIFDEEGRPQDYRWVETNPAFERHTGLVGAVGKTAREMVPNLEPHWLEIYGRIATTGQSERFQEGSSAMGRWFEVEAFPIGETEERRVALLFTDITERRQTERALQEADRRKTEFLATLAHELRNPLAPIRSGIELIKRVGDDPKARSQACATMDRQIRQLVTLVDDLLDVSRIDRGRLELRRCRVKLAEIVTSSLESMRTTIEKAQQQLSVALPEAEVYLHADPNRLVQVLTNLLSNASKYTPEGGSIALTGSLSEEGIAIEVRDTGIGIPKDMQERVFEMFTQIDRPEERGYTGLGIGLTLARSLAELHGGRLDVASEGEGLGSVFTVRLPVAERPNVPASEPQVSAPRRRKRRPRVLVVDDNEEAARMLSLLLNVLGSESRVAFSGREALDLADEFLPDLVFMDLGMPEMDGFEAARELRARPWGANARLVALTGWGQQADRDRTREAGFDQHLVKPADPAELERLLSAL